MLNFYSGMEINTNLLLLYFQSFVSLRTKQSQVTTTTTTTTTKHKSNNSSSSKIYVTNDFMLT
jgi:hypothetical protein